VWSASTLPTGYNQGIQCSFVQSGNGWQNYGSVMTMNTYSGGGGALQMYVPYSPTYGGTGMQVRFGNYDVSSGNSWTAWKTLLASDNYTAYSSFSGAVTSGGNNGFRNDVYYSNVRNPIWCFGNASAYGISYFQGGSGVGGLDAIGFHPNGVATAAGSAFNVVANGNVTALGNITAYSDERLKKDWEDLSDDFLDRLAEVQHGTYTRIDTGMRQIGVGANSLKLVSPEGVIDGEYLAVAYGNVALAAAVELAKRVVEQDARIAKLEALVAQLTKGNTP